MDCSVVCHPRLVHSAPTTARSIRFLFLSGQLCRTNPPPPPPISLILKNLCTCLKYAYDKIFAAVFGGKFQRFQVDTFLLICLEQPAPHLEIVIEVLLSPVGGHIILHQLCQHQLCFNQIPSCSSKLASIIQVYIILCHAINQPLPDPRIFNALNLEITFMHRKCIKGKIRH